MEEKRKKKKLSLSAQIMIGLVVGVILGLIFGENISVIEFIGTIFMRLLKMCVYPLVLISIIRAIANVIDIMRLRKVGIWFVIYDIFASAICACIGCVACIIFKPGQGIDLSALEAYEETESVSLIDAFVSWVPENPFESLAEGELVQIIFFAIIFGVILSKLRRERESGETLFSIIDALDELLNRMVNGVLHVAPFGVCSLVAVTIGTIGTDMLKGIGVFLIAYYVAIFMILLIFFPLVILLGGRLNPIRYFKNVLPVILMAATTMSSVGTLPVTIRTSKERLGIPSDMADLLAPIGATVNMQGAAAEQCTYVFLTMYLYDIDLTPIQIALTIVLGVVMSIGASGVPGGHNNVLGYIIYFGNASDYCSDYCRDFYDA